MKILRSYFWYVPTIIWMIMIFNMSGQVASTSQGFSLRVTQKIVNVIEIVRDGDEEDAEHLTNILHPYVRKAAHMNEYAILYTLLLLSFCASTIVTRAMFYSILVSFVYACTDEFHQTFVSLRSGDFIDVCIDMTGVMAAVTLSLFVYSASQLHRMKRNRE